jgi:hypothetical protein
MALGEVTICTLAGPWRMVGASASKQCCSKQCCSLGAADAIGAMRRIRLTRSVDRSPGHAAPSASQCLKCGWARSVRRAAGVGRVASASNGEGRNDHLSAHAVR